MFTMGRESNFIVYTSSTEFLNHSFSYIGQSSDLGSFTFIYFERELARPRDYT